MKRKLLYLVYAFLLIGAPCMSQKQSEIILNGAWANWQSETGPLTINMSITVNNPSFSGNNFNSKLNNNITEYINGKMIKDTSSFFPNADWAGTKNMLLWTKVPGQYLKNGTSGKIVIKVDNYEYHKSGNKSAPQKISVEISYKIILQNGKLIVANMQNRFPDGNKIGNDYKALQDEGIKTIKEDNSLQNQENNSQQQNKPDQQGGISLETNPATGKPWKYVVSDGSNYVVIDISLPGVKTINYTVEGNKGSLSSSTGNQGNGNGSINLSSGTNKLYYFPPKDIPESAGALTANTQQGKPVRYFPSKIKFNYTGTDGNEQSKTIDINYCRTPVILIHGFTGDKSTWELLDRMLIQKGYMTHRSDYYARNELSGSMDIAAQSYLLESNIKNELEIFSNNNLKCANFDLVCHSMGGLIARHYSNIHPSKGKFIRKIIMVGTPNHGIYDAARLMAGEAAAYFSDAHKGMAKDVDATSPVMRQFNSEEKTGSHINPYIQYGNIYVEGTDGVVDGRSARLNGVAEVLLTSMKHSPAIPNAMGYGTKSITTDFMVFGKVLNWLSNPIPKASLNMNKWDNENTLSAGKEYDLTGKGDVLKVLKGNLSINTELRTLNADASTTAEINYADGSKVSIKPGTRINYNHDLTEILLHRGKTIYNLKKQGQIFKVITPSLQAGVKGTCFEVSVNDQGASDVYLFDGELEIENLSGKRTIHSAQMVAATNEKLLKQSNFNPDSRYKTEWASATGFPSLDMFSGKPGAGFSNVVIGGESMVKNNSNASGNCLGKLNIQFLVPLSGSPQNQQQQAQMKIASDHNNWEAKWFKDAENNFKKGIYAKELSGTYRPNPNGKAGSGKYYSETVILFEPMKIRSVAGEAEGFRIVHGDSRKESYFTPLNSVVGTVLQCGSYKIFVDPNEKRATNWVTVKLEKID